jgi:circadian clock protein KaiC
MGAHLPKSQARNAASGIAGLDDVLNGGFARGSLFLVEGNPGTGKTTLALRFLVEGASSGESCLHISLSETKSELIRSAASHGWTLEPHIEVFELQPPDSVLDPKQAQSLLYSSDLELGETITMVFAAVERAKPSRIVLDSLSEIRLLAQNSLRYRRQLLAMKHYFAQSGATVLALDDLTADANDKTAHSIAHGVIRLEELTPDYGAERRRLRVMKYRGQVFRGGFHDFAIKTGGLEVYPRLVSSEHKKGMPVHSVSSGNAELDALLGGGLESGSSTLILGPAGAGKSLLMFQFINAACGRGDKASMFAFDEELGLMFRRSRGMGIDLEKLVKAGNLRVTQVDTAELSPGEFAHRVRKEVTENGASVVVIDSLNGYQQAMPNESHLILHIHELLQFLNRQGATTFLTVAQHGLVGDMKTPVDVTYLADSVILLRFFEAEARVRRAMSVVKKRTGLHENTIREFSISDKGLAVGPPLVNFHGVLRGIPTYRGPSEPLLDDRS